ncbi:hypothetical protein Sjap_021951 [Stephania japonica]|uniref:Uncharacterized protein n=1 Tax=Stephania japonica TaxID=461633 RepID=A0AAP0ENC6_9MAGN
MIEYVREMIEKKISIHTEHYIHLRVEKSNGNRSQQSLSSEIIHAYCLPVIAINIIEF